jgi:parallel beta-helix repeat protein
MRATLVFASLWLCASAATAATYHVSMTGDDGAAGTDTAPWQTIQHAADVAAPGDTVTVHAGTYVGFTVATVATETAPIAFVADGAVMIDGAATADQDAIHIDGAAWIRVEGFTVTHATRTGISAIDCSHITVRGNRVDQNGKWGVFSAFCEDFVVENNELSRSGTQHGVYASNSADRPVIRGNTIWGNAQCGIHINGDISQGGDGVISGAVIENNVIRDNGRLGGSGINGDGIVGAVIRNNVLDGNHASGISLYQIDGGAPSTGNQVINNTVRMASDARWALNIQDGSTGNVARNNVLLDANAASGAIDICATCMTGMLSDHNAVVGRFSVGGTNVDLATWHAQTGNDGASFVATDGDLFVDAAAGNLALRSGASAIDAGDAAGAPDVDVLGTARPQGAAIDIGAYEYCDGACVGGGSGSGSGGGSGSSGDGSGSGGASGDPMTAAPGGGCNAGGSGGAFGLVLLFALIVWRRPWGSCR